jgi:hypothetical protein
MAFVYIFLAFATEMTVCAHLSDRPDVRQVKSPTGRRCTYIGLQSAKVITGGYTTTADVRNRSFKRLNDNKPILSLAPLGPTKYHIDHIDHIGHIATSAEKMSPK